GDKVLTAVELGPARHVLGTAVGVPGANDDLQIVLRLEDRRGRQYFQTLNARITGARPRRAGGDPVGDDVVIRGVRLDLLSTAVRYRLRWLEQDETAARLTAIDAPPQSLPRQHEMIAVRIVAAQRQFQSALAGERAMTCPGIAAGPRHHGDDVV